MSVRPLSPALAEKARVELNEDPKRLAGDLQSIKEWLSKQPHMNARTDDQWLICFLRGCKFSLERTKEKLEQFYTLKTIVPELFQLKHNNPLFMEILSLESLLILPKAPGPDGPRVVIVRPGRCDPDKYQLLDVMSVSNTLYKLMMLEDDQAVVAGTLNILDLENSKLAHFLQMTPVLMKKMVAFGQDAVPLRMKGTHYLNTPTGFETIFNAVKGLLNEKNRSRLHVHNKDYEAMYKHIPKDILPVEYGGNGGTVKEIVDYWKNKIVELGPWLEEDEKFGTDESKRVGKPKTSEEMFGTEGSFRQLEFD